MIHHHVHNGHISENLSTIWGLFIIQTGEEGDASQSRAVLTAEQVEQHIERLQRLLAEHRAMLTEKTILNALAGGAKLRWVPSSISGKPAEFCDTRRCFLDKRELTQDEQLLVTIMAQDHKLKEVAGPELIVDLVLPD